MRKTTKLREMIASGKTMLVPGVYDGLSARIAQAAGATLLYATGGGIARSTGIPDMGLINPVQITERLEQIVDAVDLPVIADFDTGYGNALNALHTLKGFERAGVAGFHIEDQEFPKRCGHTPGRRVVPCEDMVRKIRVAVDARDSRDFLIVARTDARTDLGLDEALRRGEAYAEAGADVLFIESPESEAEMASICERLRGVPLLANIVEGGRTPELPRDRLRKLGYSISIHPGSAFMAAAAACAGIYQSLKESGSTANAKPPLLGFPEMNELIGFPAVWDFEKRHPES